MTNGDRIRIMSDEELAEFLMNLALECEYQGENFPRDCKKTEGCQECFCDNDLCLKWLKQDESL